MRVLLDTHAFLWWISGDRRLSARAHEIIADTRNRLLLSAATGWEIAVKAERGRIELPAPVDRFIGEQLALNGIEPLAILMAHALRVRQLPPLHRDPFDRMLIVQAQVEKLAIVTRDPQISQYDVETLW